jgi:hypothetical protein
MNSLRRTLSERWPGLKLRKQLGAAAFGLALVGCGREEIQVYTVPKDKPAAPLAATHAHTPRPQVSWTLPAGWKETGPGQMSVASFAITGADGKEAQVTITPLARLAGRDAEIVNMWRETVGLQALTREEAARQFTPVEVAGEPGNLFEIAGKPEDGSEPASIVTAMVHRMDASWFYKLSGDTSVVEAQKPAFLEFLKSIRLKEGAAAPLSPSSDETPTFSWKVPENWKQVPAGRMQVAKFAVPQREKATGEVFVSVFPNDTGGLLANVNRWRKEIGLPDATEGDLSSFVKAIDPARPEAKLIDLTNSNRRLIAAIIPRNGSYWFYKLRGDAEAVTPERDAFLNFVNSQP